MGTDATCARGRALVTCVLALLLTLLAAGCDVESLRGEPTTDSTRVLGRRAWVVVTTDGGRRLVSRRSVRLERGMSALDMLENVANVALAPDGTVAQVNGMGGGALSTFGPDPSAWFYRVDGIEGTSVRPAEFLVQPGQSIWWDLRRFDIYERIPVAIGTFPEPLFSGWRDTERPLRIAYGKGFRKDAEFLKKSVFRQLEPDIVSVKGDDGFAGIGGEDSAGEPKLDTTVAVRRQRANLVIARWEQARLDPFIVDMNIDGRRFGVTTWIEGTDIMRQDPDMEFPQRLGDAEGLVWASTTDAQADGTLVFLITGITDEGVRAALRALRTGGCQFYLACAVDREGNVLR